MEKKYFIKRTACEKKSKATILRNYAWLALRHINVLENTSKRIATRQESSFYSLFCQAFKKRKA